MSSGSDTLEDLSAELEALAARLRAGEVSGDEAAGLVQRCSEVAARLGSELDARSRAASEVEGQERLL